MFGNNLYNSWHNSSILEIWVHCIDNFLAVHYFEINTWNHTQVREFFSAFILLLIQFLQEPGVFVPPSRWGTCRLVLYSYLHGGIQLFQVSAGNLCCLVCLLLFLFAVRMLDPQINVKNLWTFFLTLICNVLLCL